MLSFRDVDAGGDDVTGRFSISRKQRTRPGDEPLLSMACDPTGLVVLREKIGTQHLEIGAEAIYFFRKEKEVPDAFALNLLHGISRGQFTSRVEAQDTSFVVEDDDQCPDRVQYGGDEVTFFLEFLFDAFEIGDVEGDTVNTPGASVLQAHHAGVAMEPDDAAIARNYAICGAQGLAGEEHLGRFEAPTLLVIGMNALIPADWILQPFFSGISERCFNLRAHIGLADTPVEIGHEDNRGYLLQQSAVFRLRVGGSHLRGHSGPALSELIENREESTQRWVGKYFCEIEQDGFRFSDIWQA